LGILLSRGLLFDSYATGKAGKQDKAFFFAKKKQKTLIN